MYYGSFTTNIPSQVIRLPPPLLTSSPRWSAVQPSPDRTSVLLLSRHECQLIRLASNSTHNLNRGNNSCLCNFENAPNATRVVLPQPHRHLTASCWITSGAEEGNNIRHNEEKDSSQHHAVSSSETVPESALHAVVALGDAQSTVSVLRASPNGRSNNTNASGAVEWTQATIFLRDEHSRLFTAYTQLSNSHATSSFFTPAWKPLETVISGQNVSAVADNAAPTDAYLICHRRGEGRYRGDGTVARDSSRVNVHGVWLASVQSETAWMVPLAMPDGNDVDEAEVAVVRKRNDNYGSSSTTPLKTGGYDRVDFMVGDAQRGHGPRIFDVHRRASAEEHQHQRLRSSFESTGGNAAGPTTGRVFAAAGRRHVGLFSTATVKPAVFFTLPDQFTSSACAPFRSERWAVTSVLEAPPAAQVYLTASGLSNAHSDNSYTYLVTMSRACRSQYRIQSNTIVQERCWLLYDCRKPSAPVWAVEAPTMTSINSSFTNIASNGEEELSGVWELPFWDDSTTEWLCSATPSTVVAPSASFGTSLICASYLPFMGETIGTNRETVGDHVPDASPPAVNPSSGVCVIISGGSNLNLKADADGKDDVLTHKRSRTDVSNTEPLQQQRQDVQSVSKLSAFPLRYKLLPPPSLAVAQRGPPCCVRALSYSDGILSYLCTSA